MEGARGPVVDIDDVVDLEMSVLDGLDVADDVDAPAGTFTLSAVRRRRAARDVEGLLE